MEGISTSQIDADESAPKPADARRTPDLSRDPLLVYDNELHVDTQRTVKTVQCLSAVWTWAVFAVVLVMITLAASLRVQLGMGGPIWTRVASLLPMLNIGIGLTVALGVFWKVAAREKNIDAAIAALPYELAWHDRDEYRLSIAGEKHSLVKSFSQQLPDEFFEPRIMRMWGAVPLSGRKTYYVLWAMSFVLTCVGLYVLRLATGSMGMWTPFLAFEFMGAIGLSWLPTLLAWPVYLRVAPGSLEVIRFSMLGGRVIQREAFDLRTARVRLMPWQIFVQPAGQSMHQIDCPWSWSGGSFLRQILIAARWRGELPPLPKDRLSH